MTEEKIMTILPVPNVHVPLAPVQGDNHPNIVRFVRDKILQVVVHIVQVVVLINLLLRVDGLQPLGKVLMSVLSQTRGTKILFSTKNCFFVLFFQDN